MHRQLEIAEETLMKELEEIKETGNKHKTPSPPPYKKKRPEKNTPENKTPGTKKKTTQAPTKKIMKTPPLYNSKRNTPVAIQTSKKTPVIVKTSEKTETPGKSQNPSG